jgi:hypothetical protein
VGANVLRWILDHVPNLPGGQQGFIKGLYLSSSAAIGNGLGALPVLTGLPLESLLPAWQMSLWADDRAALGVGAVQQPSWNLANIFGTFPTTGRLVPRDVDWSEETSISALIAEGSAHYTLLRGATKPSTTFAVERSGGSLPNTVKVWILRVQ